MFICELLMFLSFQGTNVSFLPKSSRLDVPPATNLAQGANKCVSLKPSNTNNKTGQPTTTPNLKQNKLPTSTPLKVELRTRSGRIVRKPPRLKCVIGNKSQFLILITYNNFNPKIVFIHDNCTLSIVFNE